MENLAVISIAVFLGFLLQTTIGFAASLIVLPILLFIYDFREATALLSLFLVAFSLIQVPSNWKDIDKKSLLSLSITGAIGLFIGIILQRSRWCIVRSLREPFMTGDAEPAVAIIAGLIIGLLGFTIIKITGIGAEMTMVVSNFWMPAIIGGIIFGFGMTIAGGCTVGSTWRAGEGHVKLWLSLIGIIIAAPLTAEYIQPSFLNVLSPSLKQQIFLPDHFGYFGSIIIMLLILLLWYLLVKWNERTGKLSAM